MMQTRKEMKKRAKQVLKKHYWLLLAVCILASFMGAEFTAVVIPSINTEGTRTAVNKALEETAPKEREQTENVKREERTQPEDLETNKYLGRKRGVLAKLVNSIDSGGILVSAVLAVHSIGLSEDAVMAVFIIGALLLSFIPWFFLTNVYRVLSRRIFLESRIYEKVPVHQLLFLLRTGK